jgi:hypothetical protein
MLLHVSEFADVPNTYKVTGKTQNTDKLCFCELCVPLCRKLFYSLFRGRGKTATQTCMICTENIPALNFDKATIPKSLWLLSVLAYECLYSAFQ